MDVAAAEEGGGDVGAPGEVAAADEGGADVGAPCDVAGADEGTMSMSPADFVSPIGKSLFLTSAASRSDTKAMTR